MAKKPKVMPAKGEESAAVIYAAVGSAISWWEAAEDALMDLFGILCKDVETIAYKTYVKASRAARASMLDMAIETYGHRMLEDERSEIAAAISRLKKLSTVRNEIAHGYVSEPTISETDADGVTTIVAEGCYLLPALSEGGWQERTPRFHHTTASILAFEEDVRDQRWTIIQAKTRMMLREQRDDQKTGSEWYMQRRMALDIVTRRLPAAEYSRYFKPMAEW